MPKFASYLSTAPQVVAVPKLPWPQQIANIKTIFADEPLILVRVDDTPLRFACRPKSSDVDVVFDTFGGMYHLPSAKLPDKPTIVDLGANIGCTALHYAAIFPGARVIAVELDEDNCELARANTRVVPGVEVVHAAIWNSDALVRYGGDGEWAFAVSSAGPKEAAGVSMRTLLSQRGITRVDFLKIDIEGGERELLAGDVSWLSQIGALKVEVHGGEELAAEITKTLAAHAFRVTRDARHPCALIAER